MGLDEILGKPTFLQNTGLGATKNLLLSQKHWKYSFLAKKPAYTPPHFGITNNSLCVSWARKWDRSNVITVAQSMPRVGFELVTVPGQETDSVTNYAIWARRQGVNDFLSRDSPVVTRRNGVSTLPSAHCCLHWLA